LSPHTIHRKACWKLNRQRRGPPGAGETPVAYGSLHFSCPRKQTTLGDTPSPFIFLISGWSIFGDHRWSIFGWHSQKYSEVVVEPFDDGWLEYEELFTVVQEKKLPVTDWCSQKLVINVKFSIVSVLFCCVYLPVSRLKSKSL
jgi:hypothetical protein